MMMNTTAESHTLLRDYAEHGSEAAFAELVRRHLNLVYSAALRRCGGDVALAEDVAQMVFTELAHKLRDRRRKDAELLRGGIPLAGWLYRHTCFVTSTAIRTESRRRQREETAMQLQSLNADDDWSRVAPVLEDAMQELHDHERDALVLRYFDQQPLLRVGTALGVSEDAARMRVDRALDKLRALLAKRGVTSTATALATALAGPAIVAAPTALVTSITSAALASTAAAGATSTLGILKFMASTKLKLGIASLVAAGVATTLVLQNQANEKLRTELTALRTQASERNVSAVDNQSAANVDADELARLRAEHEELLRLRGEAGKLRRMEADAARMQAENARLRTAQPDKSSAKSPEQIEEEREAFKYFAIAKMSHAKAWGLAFVLFADENGGLMPKTFEAAAKHLPASDSESALRVQDQFEIVFQGALKDLEKPNATIIVREKTPFTSLAQPDSPNKIWRAYGFADGHSEFHGTPDGDFEAWEKEHLAQPLPR